MEGRRKRWEQALGCRPYWIVCTLVVALWFIWIGLNSWPFLVKSTLVGFLLGALVVVIASALSRLVIGLPLIQTDIDWDTDPPSPTAGQRLARAAVGNLWIPVFCIAILRVDDTPVWLGIVIGIFGGSTLLSFAQYRLLVRSFRRPFRRRRRSAF